MKIEKTFYGFSVKNIWNGEIKAYRLFSAKKEYSLTFMGDCICKITLKGSREECNKIRIIYSRNMNIPENEIAEIGIKIIEAAASLN